MGSVTMRVMLRVGMNILYHDSYYLFSIVISIILIALMEGLTIITIITTIGIVITKEMLMPTLQFIVMMDVLTLGWLTELVMRNVILKSAAGILEIVVWK